MSTGACRKQAWGQAAGAENAEGNSFHMGLFGPRVTGQDEMRQFEERFREIEELRAQRQLAELVQATDGRASPPAQRPAAPLLALTPITSSTCAFPTVANCLPRGVKQFVMCILVVYTGSIDQNANNEIILTFEPILVLMGPLLVPSVW